MKKIVALTGAGISQESGFATFRDAGGLWEQYPVEKVASHTGWLADPDLVNRFYNERRKQLFAAEPNKAHILLAELEKEYDVVVATQNVDNLHERAGSSHVIHLHGELLKVCSSRNVEDTRYHRVLTADDYEVKPGELAGDGSRLRPYIVFFEEAVPMLGAAAEQVQKADIFLVIGTSLNVYPAAGLVHYTRPGTPIYVIDPKSVPLGLPNTTFIQEKATVGMQQLYDRLTFN